MTPEKLVSPQNSRWLLVLVRGLVHCLIVPNPRGGWSPGPGWASRSPLGHLPLQPFGNYHRWVLR